MKYFIIILLLLTGCSLKPVFLGGTINRTDKINSIIDIIQIGNIEKTIAYTDENEGESFIVKTDNKDYYSLGGGIKIYGSITNVSETDQSAYMVISLGNGQTFNKVERFVGNDIIYDIIPATATTTKQTIEQKIAIWENIEFDTKFKVSDSNLIRKDIKERKISGVFKDYFKAGETKYYRLSMEIPYGITEHEWFWEVFGEKSYGHLDPNNWTYEQKFNELNDGDLHGQDSWSGAVEFDVTTDAAARYEGAKGIKIYQPAGVRSITRTLPASIDSGTFYISVKKTDNTDNLYPGIVLRNDGNLGEIYINFYNNGKIYYYSKDTGTNVQIDDLTYESDVWIRLGIRFRCTGAAAYEGLAERTFQVNVDDGDWSSALKFFRASGADIIYLNLDGYASAGKYNYFDYISPVYSEAPTDTCTYSGTGDWYVLYSDNCYITEDIYVLENCYLVNDGIGSFGINGATISCKKIEQGYGFDIQSSYNTQPFVIRYQIYLLI